MAYNGQQALQEALKKAAEEKVKYENNLVGKVFAYAYVDPKINQVTFKEVEFKTENFLHLTGLDYFDAQYKKRVLKIDTPTRADEFYERLGKDSTLIQDVSFIKGSTQKETADNIKTAQRKLRNLSQLVNIAKKAEYIGRYKNPNKFDLLVNRSVESLALNKDGEVYIPISSRYGIVDKHIDLKDKNLVLAIFSKNNNQKDFKLMYLNKKVANVDKAYFDSKFLEKLSLNSFTNDDVKFNKDSLSTIRYSFMASSIKNTLEKISQKRSHVYDSDLSCDEYTKICDSLYKQLDNYFCSSSDKDRQGMSNVISAYYKDQHLKVDSLDNVDLIYQEINEINKAYSKYPDLNLSVNIGDEAFDGAAAIANAIKAPTADLLKNKKTNLIMSPKRNRNVLSNKKLHSSLFQGNTIALAMPNPQPSFEEIIRNTIAQLSEVAQKITKFFSSSIHSFAQEQPPQARTAHERKINSELPFPKQKPADERIEPVTAKQEKAQKSEVKPSEKQSSWIGNLISSARSESDAHNKNHEPKAHDKDKSL